MRDEDQTDSSTSHPVKEESGVGPWPGGKEQWPAGCHYDLTLLAEGDHRNVQDEYRYWTMDAIREDIARKSRGFEIAIENVEHDFNIGSIIRTANALGVSRVHIIGRRRWNRRGAMVTERYLDVDHLEKPEDLAKSCAEREIAVIGIDNIPGSRPLEEACLPEKICMVFGGESAGLSVEMQKKCQTILHITQYGSTRSINVGHAAAIAMWAWGNKC